MRENAVQRDSSFFVSVESLIQVVAQEAPVLRNAFAVDPRRRSDGIGRVLGIGGEVTDGGEAPAGNDRIGDHVNVFVDLSGLKSPFRWMCRSLATILPSTVWANCHSVRGMTVRFPLRESRTVSRLRVSSGAATGYSVPPILPRMRCPSGISGMSFRGHQIAAQQAGDGLSVVFGDRGKESQRIGPIRIPLPAQAHDGKAVAQQPGVSGIAGEVLVAAIDQRENARAASVRDFQKHRAVALVRVLGANRNEVGGELDLAIFQVDRVAEIDDALVVRIGDGKREIDASGEALVGARVAELLAVEDIGVRGDFDTEDARV